jgi:hypothetical protein
MATNNVQQDAEFMKNIPTWARAWVALLTVGVTVLLALNLNIGGFWDKQLDAAITRQQAQSELGKGSLDGLVEISKGLLEQNSELLKSVNLVIEQNNRILALPQPSPKGRE